MSDKVTIRRIADICNVSPTTVSLVLNKKAGVSDGTRERVLNTAKELGYKLPILTARTKHRRLSTVGIVLKTEPELLPPSNPFYSQILAGVDDVCSDIGVNLLFSMLPVDENNYPKRDKLLVDETMVDGLLIVGTFIDETIVSLFRQNYFPVVLVDGYSDTESFDMVISDNFGGAYQAVEYLIKLGHRHIGLIGSEEGCYPSLSERRNGYRRVLKDHRITDMYLADFNVNVSQGEEETIKMLTENPQITALFGVNDNVALGAMRAARRLNRQVPKDLSIIGYDNTYLATSVSPTLTTMHVDKLAMGRAAVHLLVLKLEQPDAARSTHIIHPNLIERDSTAPLG